MGTRSSRRTRQRIPVTVKDRATHLRPDGTAGRVEVWSATSTDGAWSFERAEEPGTPWLVFHRDVTGWYGSFSSLPKARAGAVAELGFRLAVCVARVWGWR